MLPVVGTGAHPTLPRLDAGVRVPRVHTLECLGKERKRRLVHLSLLQACHYRYVHPTQQQHPVPHTDTLTH